MAPLHVLLAISVAFVWGVNFVAIKSALEVIPPFTLGVIRFTISALPILLGVPFPKTHWRNVACIGLFQGFIKFSFLFTGVSLGLSSCHASLTLQTQAFFTLLFSAVFLKTAITKANMLGILIAFMGLALLGYTVKCPMVVSGMVMIFIAAISWAVSNIYYKKAGNVDMFAVVIWSSLFSVPPFWICSLLMDGPSIYPAIVSQLNVQVLGAVFYVCVVATLYGSTAWGYLMKKYNPAIVAPYTLLVSIFAMLAGYLLLGEELTFMELIAGLIIMVGLAVNQMPYAKVRMLICKLGLSKAIKTC